MVLFTPLLLLPIVLICEALALVELWIPLFAAVVRSGVSAQMRAWPSPPFCSTGLWMHRGDSCCGTIDPEQTADRRGAYRASVSILDLTAYFAHWTLHKSPLLWRVHRVHHCDPFVDVTTAFRQHDGPKKTPDTLDGMHANVRVSQRLDRAVARV
jgi:hypothetical protein